MAVYPIWQSTIQDGAGNIVPSAQITVIDEATGLLATIYSGRTGGSLANPFNANSSGFVQFFAPSGLYRINAKNTITLEEQTWRYVKLIGADPLVAPQYAPRSTGDDVETVFNSSISVYDNPENFEVKIDGLDQRPVLNYDVTELGEIEFTSPPPIGSVIDIVYMAIPASGQNVEQFSERLVDAEASILVNAADISAINAELDITTPTANFSGAYAAMQDLEIPALIQNYKQQRSFLNQVISDPVTFSRASSGTYIDASGVMQTASSGVPRYTHNPVTLEPIGLLFEDQRTNLCTYSDDFTQTGWTLSRATVSDNGDGWHKLTCDSTAGNTHALNKTGITKSGSTYYTKSIEAKKGVGTYGRYLFLQTNSFVDWVTDGRAIFDLELGTVVSDTLPTGYYGIKDNGNGSFLCWIMSLTEASPSSTVFSFEMSNGTMSSFDGDGVSYIYLKNPQIEAGYFPTSYIPTTSSAVTRIADTKSDSINMTQYISGDRGTVFADFYVPYLNPVASGANGRQVIWRIRDLITDKIIALMYTSGKLQIQIYNGSSSTYSPLTGTISTTQRNKVAISFKVVGGSVTPLISLNGATVVGVTATGFSMPSVTNFYIGSESGGSTRCLNGTISRISTYKRALSQTELNRLTA